MSAISMQKTAANRLTSTLFVATLAYGALILGVTFRPGLPEPSSEELSVKVTLLADSPANQKAPDDASFVANRNAFGGSAGTSSRPATTPTSQDLLTLRGDEGATDLDEALVQEEVNAGEQLLTRKNEDRSAADVVDADAVAARQMHRANLISSDAPPTLAAEVRETAELAADADDRTALGPSAKASILAEYRVRWRQRVEQMGTSHFPEKFLQGASGRRPVVEVAIGADGSLAQATIERSSGSRELDQAALSILRMAAPFEPLPSAVLDDFQTLKFAYEWDFIEPAADE